MASPQNRGIFRTMSPAFSLLSSNKDGLSSKEKKYINGVEKLITSFDTSIVEWADHISFLSRLLKALQANPQTELTRNYIPFDMDIAKCLSISLSRTLPSGVHKKALEVYDSIFQTLGEKLSDTITIWLPGLLPLMSYASIGVKPQLLDVFRMYIVKLPAPTLNRIIRPLLLSLLTSIDDETSENFNDCLALLDTLKANLQNDSRFWNAVFLIIASSNDKRLGALIWCQRRLPSFNTEEESDLSEDAKNCIDPDSTLLVKALSKGLRDENILVQRGFFDLLSSQMELKSCILQKMTQKQDLVNLVISASFAALRRDMSLNRRLWNWILGPDDQVGEDKMSRSQYFAQYGFDALSTGLLTLINGEDKNKSLIDQRVHSFKIALALMDRWEIGQLIIPRILTPILINTEKLSSNEEVLKSANIFFDNVDCYSIWANFLHLVLAGDFDLCLFILQNFNVEEEEMLINHLPLILLAALGSPHEENCSWIQLLLSLTALIPQRAYLPIEHHKPEVVDGLTSEIIVQKITQYYEEEDQAIPFRGAELSFILLEQVSQLLLDRILLIYDQKLGTDPVIYKVCVFYADILDKVPEINNGNYANTNLKDAIFAIGSNGICLDLVFGIGKIFPHIIKFSEDIIKRSIFLQDFLTQLWNLLSSPLAVKYQVEIVKLIFQLEMSMPADYVQSCLTALLNEEESTASKLNKFTLLWTHSSKFQDSGIFLSRSIELLMDDLRVNANVPYVKSWIMALISNGNFNRFAKILITPLLDHDYLKGDSLKSKTDSQLCVYQLENIINLIGLDARVSELLKSEMMVIDNEQLATVVATNKWEDLTFKSLLIQICLKLIALETDSKECFITSLKLINLIIDGTETEFKTYFLFVCDLSIELDDPLMEAEVLSSILYLLHCAKTKSLKLFSDEEINDTNVIFILLLKSISRAQNSNTIIPLMALLSESLRIFEIFMFNIVTTVSTAIIAKIGEFFDNFQAYIQGETETISQDLDQSVSLLMNGLEELLSVSHSYLVAYQQDLGESSNASGTDNTGFFGSVIQGVFQLDSHHDTSSGLVSKKFAVLSSFKNSVYAVYRIWLWAEVNSKVSALHNNHNNKSLTYIATRYKYRSKKFLEFLYLIEPSELIESLISYNMIHNSKLIYKVLHVLDGSRPNLTLPHLFKSITNRCSPGNDSESINKELDGRYITKFLFAYFESLDSNIYEDLFSIFNGFTKNITANVAVYRHIFPSFLRCIVLFNVNLGRASKKYKRDLNEHYFKILSIVSNSKLDASDKHDFLISLNYSIPLIKNMQFDTDKQNAIFNTIINFVQPHLLKNDLSDNYVEECIILLNQEATSKTWKSLVSEATINDSGFFNKSEPNLVFYSQLISNNFDGDCEKINDLLARLATNNSNFLNWNDYTEVLNSKRLALKKVIYLISCCQKNCFMNSISEIINKIRELLPDKDLKSQLYLLVRCLLLKFDDTHLSNLWVLIYSDLYKLFSLVLEDPGSSELATVLSASKLLDLLMLLKSEEFQVDEWLFIEDTKVNSTVSAALIDKIAALNLQSKEEADVPSVVKDEAAKEFIQHSDPTIKVPLLLDVKSVDSLTQLQTDFFSKLASANYMHVVMNEDIPTNYDILIQDIFNDLFL